MFGWTECVSRRVAKRAAVLLAGLAAMVSVTAAQAETRTIRLYHVNLQEKTEITFKRDGKYLSDGLKKANWALRDWRESNPTNMDPKLLDLLWEAYQQSGARGYINVLGGYRSPSTNKMLRSRSRSSGVAGTSLHMSGKAVDFFIPGVPLKKLRDIGLRMQLGGVGYYPRSGSPFVHFDTGKGRYWPRMSRSELAQVFPKGNTIHLPTDGKPLPGYETALASYNKRKGSNDIQIASSSGRSGGGKSLLAMIFGGGADEAEDEAAVTTTPVARKPAAPVRAAPEPEVQIAAVRPSRAAPQPPAVLPAGVPMPDRDAFDSSVPRAQPPAALPAAAAETEVAALVPVRVPLPTTAPNRPAAADAVVPRTLDETLVAALEEEAQPAAPGQLAYAVPTPRERPPFEAVLRNERVALPTPRMIGGEPELTPEAIIAAAMADAAAPAPSVIPVAYPPARHEVSQVAAAMLPAARTAPAEKPLVVAALERRPAPSPVAATAPAAKRPGNAKGGRVVGDDAALAAAARSARRPAAASAAMIARRIEIASLITNPERRAMETKLARPVADGLIGNIPAAVFARGFSAKGASPSGPQRFEGTAVNFLPVRKID